MSSSCEVITLLGYNLVGFPCNPNPNHSPYPRPNPNPKPNPNINHNPNPSANHNPYLNPNPILPRYYVVMFQGYYIAKLQCCQVAM